MSKQLLSLPTTHLVSFSGKNIFVMPVSLLIIGWCAGCAWERFKSHENLKSHTGITLVDNIRWLFIQSVVMLSRKRRQLGCTHTHTHTHTHTKTCCAKINLVFMSGNLFLAAETSGKVLRTNSLKGPFSQTLKVARLSF